MSLHGDLNQHALLKIRADVGWRIEIVCKKFQNSLALVDFVFVFGKLACDVVHVCTVCKLDLGI